METRADLLTKLLRLTRPLSREINAANATMLEQTRLTVRMRTILEVLEREGPLTVPAIAGHLQIKRQYAQVMINEVTRSGFAERSDNPAHRRSDLYALTNPGKQVVTGMAGAEEAIVKDIATGFTTAEIDQALTVLEAAMTSYSKLNSKLGVEEAAG